MQRAIIAFAVAVAVAPTACGVQPRFPDDVSAAFARDPMRRLETAHFIIYYPAQRRAEIDRFVARAERCVDVLMAAAPIHNDVWREKKIVAMPDEPFNNAYVQPQLAGYEEISVIPTYSTFDFTSEFGLIADPGYIACHELTHYTQFQQRAGTWRIADAIFGDLYNPQIAFDPWQLEGLATHYENALNPGFGRPTWPLFTGVFAAGYAGHRMNGGDLSVFGRLATAGHQYLVGAMFTKFLAEQYGEHALWAAVGAQATGLFALSAHSFSVGFGKPLGALIDEFSAWKDLHYPVRARPSDQRVIASLGADARYARGRDGTEAWVDESFDRPAQLVVRDARGKRLVEVGLTDIAPPRTLVTVVPIEVSGLSVTADGNEVWLTAVDSAATYAVTRLLRWRRGERGLTEIATDLGPGATISPDGATYYYCAVDGDRWSLAGFDVRAQRTRVVRDMPPSTYITGARVSPDGARLVADVFDGVRFVEWELDAQTGETLRELRGAGTTAVFDASYLGDGRLMWLGDVDGRFQIVVEGRVATDVPYAAYAAREANGTIRFLDREGWRWQLDEILLPPVPTPLDAPEVPVVTPPPVAMPSEPMPAVESDRPFSRWEHFLYPQLRAPTLLQTSDETTVVGFALGGGDRLSIQRWQLTGYWQPSSLGPLGSSPDDKNHFGADAQYLDLDFAPVQLFGEATTLAWTDSLATGIGNATISDERRTRELVLSAQRTIRGSTVVALSGLYTDDRDRGPGLPTALRHVAGPQLAVSYDAIESTPYVGVRRELDATAEASYYPGAASSFASNIVDVGGSLGGTLPLPFGRRHTLTVLARGRALLAPHETGLLQLGGDGGVNTIWLHDNASTAPPSYDASRFPEDLAFIEPLRGYEDYAITTDRAAIVDATYQYPLIIDRGAASVARVFPAVWLAELDLAVFGAAAVDAQHDAHAAAGAAITARLAIWRFPGALAYQIARRLRDDDALVQLLTYEIDLPD